MAIVQLNKNEIHIACNALDCYAEKAEGDAQWDDFVSQIRELNDKLFHLLVEEEG